MYKRILCRLLSVIPLILSPFLLRAQEVDFNEFVVETQKHIEDEDIMIMVWWMPTEIWVEMFKSAPDTSDDIIQQTKDVLNPYAIFFRIGLVFNQHVVLGYN